MREVCALRSQRLPPRFDSPSRTAGHTLTASSGSVAATCDVSNCTKRPSASSALKNASTASCGIQLALSGNEVHRMIAGATKAPLNSATLTAFDWFVRRFQLRCPFCRDSHRQADGRTAIRRYPSPSRTSRISFRIALSERSRSKASNSAKRSGRLRIMA